MTPTLGGVRNPGTVSPELQRKLLRAQQKAQRTQATADKAEAELREVIREAAVPPGSSRAVAEVLGVSHMTVQRIMKSPAE